MVVRLSALFLLFGLLGITLADFDQEAWVKDAECDRGCSSESWVELCTQQQDRGSYFCCLGEKCAPSVPPGAIFRLMENCEHANMPFTFDAEDLCGIKPGTDVIWSIITQAFTKDAESTVTTSTTSASASSESTSSTPASAPGASSTATSGASSTGSQTVSGTPTPTTNSAPGKKAMLNAAVFLVAAAAML